MSITQRLKHLTANSLIIPQLNMNGTSKQELLDSWLELADILRNAIETMQRTATLLNGRDFVPQGGDNWRKAIEQHKARLKKLQEVKLEVDAIIDGIDQQKGR